MSSASSARPGPLVEPGPPLSNERKIRASRQLVLPGFSEEAQRRLSAARVLVIGAGGLGSASIPYLAGSGVGTIGIVDNDVVELSNLHRQVSHGMTDIGRSKATSLVDTVRELDPSIHVIAHQERLTSQNARDLFSGYDLVVDGSDNFPTRYLVDDAARLNEIPLVWGAILRTHGQVGLAWHEHGPGYRDLFPKPPGPDGTLSCVEGGVLPGLCGTIGSLLATETLKVITGLGDLLIGRVVVYDAMSVGFREIQYDRDPNATPVTELIDYELFCAGEAEVAPAMEDVSAVSGEVLPSVTTAEIAAQLSAGAAPRLIDVRSPEEYEARRLVGTELVPLPDIVSGASIEPGEALVIVCEHGPRAERAASLLARQGHDVTVLTGGTSAFAAEFPEHIEGSFA